ncbi:uncharacterized protein KY384_000629 [Bacidia gigantensis]|uniref:uncharacterized protein n=1 Tax=Bacidia gigantensis TaxID=2732470 RepID=UPI001D059BE1|nr:uncharacterized protein KY384_000629 [Bacidia gigantensis]KAG8525869.1 hypothetical protein KY384_000629 [Bacidia gigantensis]
MVLSASRDATVRQWKPTTSNKDSSIICQAQSFVNTITFIPPSTDHPQGLVVTGGKEAVIDVRPPGRGPEENAERLLLGHAHNVCALDVSVDGNFIISGSWDGTARVWSIKSWDCEAVLEGHTGSVWTVLAYDKKTIITGCADRVIRVFDPSGKKYSDVKGSTDVVRALCRTPSSHYSGADFASTGNDAIIRLWKLNGKEIGQLHGHESFVYSLVCLPSGELVSSGEDRTVRVWRNRDCIQTITHPAISVWGVAASSENGDIVSGASDRIVRVFSRAEERQAAAEDIKAFEDTVKSSSIPRQQMEENDNEQYPSPEFLQQKSGTKEGQVQMIREANGNVSAYQWSQGAQSWVMIGTVVDSAGSSGKKTSHGGKDYDYVFDVDIEDGKPPLKLPYNLSQNPYEAATKFIQDNELPITYLDQVANFITTNTQGAALGQASVPTGADPWGSESRYRPGDAESAQFQTPVERPKLLPQTKFLSITTANLRIILKKITEFNGQLAEERSEYSLDQASLQSLDATTKSLEAALASGKPSDQDRRSNLDSLATRFAASSLRPHPPSRSNQPFRGIPSLEPNDIVTVLLESGFEDRDRENNIMLTVRAFGNLFETPAGQALVDKKFESIHNAVKRYVSSSNRNLSIAITTLYMNYAVLFTRASAGAASTSVERALPLLDELTKIVVATPDSEAVYRTLVALGTLLELGEEVQMAAKNIYGVLPALERIAKKLKEPRIKAVVQEIEKTLS